MPDSSATDSLTALFPPKPIPRPSEIVVPFEGDSDRLALRAALSGKAWTSITFEYLKKNYPGPLSESFAYLTAKGQAYYLPAFLKMVVDSPEQVDDLPGSILFYFAENGKRRDELVSMLTVQQKRHLMVFFEKQFGAQSEHRTEVARVRKMLE
jgi:hypothetical protein